LSLMLNIKSTICVESHEKQDTNGIKHVTTPNLDRICFDIKFFYQTY
ncbi:19467_t:CDS:1, partial [Racocetra fulgida]